MRRQRAEVAHTRPELQHVAGEHAGDVAAETAAKHDHLALGLHQQTSGALIALQRGQADGFLERRTDGAEIGEDGAVFRACRPLGLHHQQRRMQSGLDFGQKLGLEVRKAVIAELHHQPDHGWVTDARAPGE